MGAASSSCRPRRALGLALAGIIIIILAGEARSEDPPGSRAADEQRKLERVREEIARLQSILDRTRNDVRSTLGDLQRLDVELALHRRQVVALGAELKQCREEIGQATARLATVRKDLETSKAGLERRIRALYRKGPLEFERVLLTSSRADEVVSAYRMAERAARSDQSRIDAYRSHESQWRQALADLEERKSSLSRLRAAEQSRRGELEGLRETRARMLAGLRQEASEQEGVLAEMTQTQEALEKLVQALSRGGLVGADLEVGFERFRGLLPWPVPGKVIEGFGARRNAKFDTLLPHPGLDLAVEEGEPIRAIYEGVVAFSDWFKGYGNLIVLEHGGGYMSVYAHSSDRLVATGDRVSAGQVIARAGDTGSLEGPKLYFEIIKDGKPENPEAWLTRR